MNYPDTSAARDRWILERRGPRVVQDPARPVAFFREEECSGTGEVVPVATVLLANRECPWRCLMCDLWQHTLEETVPPGAIPGQIDIGLAGLRDGRVDAPAPRWLKLYNAGSFFDPRAIPPQDLPAIAARAAGFDRLVVECHPALVTGRVTAFRDLLPTGVALEVAVGLETAHPGVLERLNKRIALEDFRRAADFFLQNHVALRVFILVQPPFLPEATEALEWAKRSVDLALDCGAAVVSLIPTRAGNGAMEALAAAGQFRPPRLHTLEAALDYGVSLRRGRVQADLWDLQQFSRCDACFSARLQRLRRMNLSQTRLAPVQCPLGSLCHG